MTWLNLDSDLAEEFSDARFDFANIHPERGSFHVIAAPIPIRDNFKLTPEHDPLKQSCPDCGEKFGTMTGVRSHQHRMHNVFKYESRGGRNRPGLASTGLWNPKHFARLVRAYCCTECDVQCGSWEGLNGHINQTGHMLEVRFEVEAYALSKGYSPWPYLRKAFEHWDGIFEPQRVAV